MLYNWCVNLLFASLILLLTVILARKVMVKTRKKLVQDERSEWVGMQAGRATFILMTIVMAVSAIAMIWFGEHGAATFSYVYYLGVILSYLTCLSLTLYMILFAYFNKQS